MGGLSLLFDEEVEKVEVEDEEGEGRAGRKKAQAGNSTCRGRNVTARPADQIVLIALKAMVAILTSDQGTAESKQFMQVKINLTKIGLMDNVRPTLQCCIFETSVSRPFSYQIQISNHSSIREYFSAISTRSFVSTYLRPIQVK